LMGFKFIRTGKRFDTKSSGMILNSYAGPKGGGQEPGVNRQDSRFGHRVSDTRSASYMDVTSQSSTPSQYI